MSNEMNTWVQTEIEMPNGYWDFRTVSVGKKVFKICGSIPPHINLYDTVMAYDFEAGEWEEKTKMLFATSSMCAAYGDGKIHVIGGTSGDNQNKHTIYDVETDTWESKPSPFSVGVCYTKGSAVYYDGLLYVAGGQPYPYGGYSGSPLNLLYVYDPVSDTWTKKADMLEGSWGTSKLIPYNGFIYHFGNCCQRYRIATDTWERIEQMPESINDSAITVLGSDVYIIGSDSGNADYAYKYSLADGTWEELPKLPQGFRHCQAETIDGTIYIFTYNVNGKVYSYSPEPDNKLRVLLEKGETAQLSMHFDLPVNLEYVWSSTNENVATVDANGLVTAMEVGVSDIYAESTDGSYRDFIPVEVIEGDKKLALHILEGKSERLKMGPDPLAVTWSSEDTDVAVVSSEGRVTGVAKGACYVTGVLNGVVESIFVRVATA